jgi:hypothetical protein
VKPISLSPLLFLAGCASCPEQTTVYVPKEVMVPVPISCQAPDVQRPEYLLNDKQIISLPLLSKCAATLSEVEQREAYEQQLEAALKACK